MDNIIFVDPSQYASCTAKTSPVVHPLARSGGATEKEPEPVDPHFSGGGNGNFQDTPSFNGDGQVSLHDIFLIEGDEDSDPTSPPPIPPNPQPEWPAPVSSDPNNDSITINPAVLAGESIHTIAQNVEDPKQTSNIDPAPFNGLMPTEERRRDATDPEPPCKRSQSRSRTPSGHPTLHSCFSAASLSDRLEFLSWLLNTGLSDSLSTASRELSLMQDKKDKLPEPTPVRQCPPRASPKGRPAKATESRKGQPANATESRKGKQWDFEEVNFLIQMKNDGLSWSMITKRFSKQFPGRTEGTIKVYWYAKLKYMHSLDGRSCRK